MGRPYGLGVLCGRATGSPVRTLVGVCAGHRLARTHGYSAEHVKHSRSAAAQGIFATEGTK